MDFTTHNYNQYIFDHFFDPNIDYFPSVKFIPDLLYSSCKPDKIDFGKCQCEGKSICLNDNKCINFATYYECGDDCSSLIKCKNRRIYKKQFKKCQVFKTPNKGFGLRTKVKLLKNDLVLEYIGEVLDNNDLQKKIQNPTMCSFNMYYLMSLDSKKKLYVDAARQGGLARFINHSCNPNCKLETWYVNGFPRACIFALTDIHIDEELTFDYEWDNRPNHHQTKCYCQSEKCRGTIEITSTKQISHILLQPTNNYVASIIPLQLNDVYENSYINSVFQMLFSTYSFIDFVYKTIHYITMKQNPNHHIIKQQICLLHSIKDLFVYISPPVTDSRPNATTSHILMWLNRFKNKNDEIFTIFERNNSYLFLSFLLNSIINGIQNEEINEYFMTQIMEEKKCCCKTDPLVRKIVLKHTSLLLIATKNTSINSLLKEYFADKKEFDSDDECECDVGTIECKTQKNVCYTKTYTITKLPKILILCVKRDLDNEHINKSISFEKHLVLKNYTDDRSSSYYSLRSINYVTKDNDSAKHYTTDCIIHGTTQWIRYFQNNKIYLDFKKDILQSRNIRKQVNLLIYEQISLITYVNENKKADDSVTTGLDCIIKAVVTNKAKHNNSRKRKKNIYSQNYKVSIKLRNVQTRCDVQPKNLIFCNSFETIKSKAQISPVEKCIDPISLETETTELKKKNIVNNTDDESIMITNQCQSSSSSPQSKAQISPVEKCIDPITLETETTELKKKNIVNDTDDESKVTSNQCQSSSSSPQSKAHISPVKKCIDPITLETETTDLKKKIIVNDTVDESMVTSNQCQSSSSSPLIHENEVLCFDYLGIYTNRYTLTKKMFSVSEDETKYTTFTNPTIVSLIKILSDEESQFLNVQYPRNKYLSYGDNIPTKLTNLISLDDKSLLSKKSFVSKDTIFFYYKVVTMTVIQLHYKILKY